ALAEGPQSRRAPPAQPAQADRNGGEPRNKLNVRRGPCIAGAMWLRFSGEDIQNVPEESGIFCLFQDRDLVYIGRTAPRTGLRTELEHALRMAMAEDIAASHFTFELTRNPKTRAAEELRDYYETWGRLPIYNRPHPSALLKRAELRR